MQRLVISNMSLKTYNPETLIADLSPEHGIIIGDRSKNTSPFDFAELTNTVKQAEDFIRKKLNLSIAVAFSRYFRDHPDAIFMISAPSLSNIGSGADIWCDQFCGNNIISRIDYDFVKTKKDSMVNHDDNWAHWFDLSSIKKEHKKILAMHADEIFNLDLESSAIPASDLLDDPEVLTFCNFLQPKEFAFLDGIDFFQSSILCKQLNPGGGFLCKKSFNWLLKSTGYNLDPENLENCISNTDLMISSGLAVDSNKKFSSKKTI
jgi:hypothetical protein